MATRRALTKQEKKNLRAKARRHSKAAIEVMEELYKPVDEWDLEELARGRPRNIDGSFRGPKPKWISAHVHEEAIRRFTEMLRGEMRTYGADALKLVHQLMTDDDLVYDDEGQPIRHLTPPSTKLQAAQFLLEQLLGKPKQAIEGDVTLKVQSILAGALVNPGEVVDELEPGTDNGEVGDDEEDDDEDDLD